MNTEKTREGRTWPGYVLGGRLRTSTLALIIAFIAIWWLYETYQPPAEAPPQVPATEVVPPGFIPDPSYTWVPRTYVQRPTEVTTTPTTTEPTEPTTTPASPTETAPTPSPLGMPTSLDGVPPPAATSSTTPSSAAPSTPSSPSSSAPVSSSTAHLPPLTHPTAATPTPQP